jgi:uncharacterized protein YaaQ
MLNADKDVVGYVEGMSLRQCLNAAMKLQSMLDEAAQDRADFLARAGGFIGTDNGTYLAYIIREDAIKALASALRDAIIAKFGKEDQTS